MILAVAAFTATVLGVVADIAQLSEFPTRVARTLLIAVGLTGLLYLVVKVWQWYFVQKVAELRTQVVVQAQALTDVRSAHQRCLEAIERSSERERPLFSETLEVTVTIGKDDDGDLVIEDRITNPKPLVTSRTMRPIVATYAEQVATMKDIAFTVHRERGQITHIPLREQINKLKVWLVFEPAMSSPTEWRVEYRPKGLWRPLRKQGFDELRWDDRLQTQNGTPSAFAHFTVVFVFPPGDEPSVKERNGHGEITGPEQSANKEWTVTWRDWEPAGRYYHWDLIQPQRS